jgi:hypothetical protein
LPQAMDDDAAAVQSPPRRSWHMPVAAGLVRPGGSFQRIEHLAIDGESSAPENEKGDAS